MNWDKPKCKHCGEVIESPEEAILALTYKRVFWHIECLITELEKEASFASFFGLGPKIALIKVKDNVDKIKTKESRKETQKFISNSTVISALGLGIIFTSISGFILLNIEKINLEIIHWVSLISLFSGGIMFIFVSLLYYYNLYIHEKMIKENIKK